METRERIAECIEELQEAGMPLNAMARDDVCPQQHAAALGEAIRLTCDVMRGKTEIKRGEADGDRAWGLIAATLGGLQTAPGPKTAALISKINAKHAHEMRLLHAKPDKWLAQRMIAKAITVRRRR